MVGTFDELEGKTFLICVGGMRCATSWVSHYLGSLPDTVVSPIKELHYFNAKFTANALSNMDVLAIKRLGLHVGRVGNPVDNLLYSPSFQASADRVQMIYDEDAYFGHFARLSTPETRVLCDITPAYAVIGQPGFEYMKTYFATRGVGLKLLYIMRDPVDRLWSQLRHMQQVNPVAEVAKRWPEAIRSPPIIARADYRGTVDNLDATFPAEDLLYLFYEQLFAETTLRRLCRFAAADYRPGETREARNAAAVKQDLPDDARDTFLSVLAPQYGFCRERFGNQLPESWAG